MTSRVFPSLASSCQLPRVLGKHPNCEDQWENKFRRTDIKASWLVYVYVYMSLHVHVDVCIRVRVFVLVCTSICMHVRVA